MEVVLVYIKGRLIMAPPFLLSAFQLVIVEPIIPR
jgi:hypothetical protein